MITDFQKPESASNHFVPLGQATPQGEHAGADEGSAAIMADMAGGFEVPVEAASKSRSRLTSQLALMFGVLIISAASLYLMRRVGTGAGMTFVAVPLDYSLEREDPNRVADHQRLIDQLESFGITVQVPMDDVEKNPFHLVLPDGDVIDLAAIEDPEAQARAEAEMRRRERERRQKDIGAIVDAIRVHAIMNGRIPVANVYDGDGDRLVRVGDTIGEYLEVVAINDRQLVLQAGGDRYTVEMDTNSTPRRKPRR